MADHCQCAGLDQCLFTPDHLFFFDVRRLACDDWFVETRFLLPDDPKAVGKHRGVRED